jgi:hypothetical protein
VFKVLKVLLVFKAPKEQQVLKAFKALQVFKEHKEQ